MTDRGGTGRQGTDPENPSSIGPPFLQQTHPTPSEREAAQMLGHTGAPRLPGGGGGRVCTRKPETVSGPQEPRVSPPAGEAPEGCR